MSITDHDHVPVMAADINNINTMAVTVLRPLCVFIVLIHTVFIMSSAYNESISIAAWNMRCNTSISQEYLKKLSKSSDCRCS